ncbi:MAG: hypothetical protein SGPRY_012506, partial [Prymnesium sp.]
MTNYRNPSWWHTGLPQITSALPSLTVGLHSRGLPAAWDPLAVRQALCVPRAEEEKPPPSSPPPPPHAEPKVVLQLRAAPDASPELVSVRIIASTRSNKECCLSPNTFQPARSQSQPEDRIAQPYLERVIPKSLARAARTYRDDQLLIYKPQGKQFPCANSSRMCPTPLLFGAGPRGTLLSASGGPFTDRPKTTVCSSRLGLSPREVCVLQHVLWLLEHLPKTGMHLLSS